MSKKLVAYFSASGVTKSVAERIAKVANADLFEIKPTMPYTNADLDWRDKTSRSSVEMSNPDSRPKIANKLDNMADYDTVLIAYEDESKQTIKDILRTIEPQKVAIIIGPEGGIAEEEVKKLKENGAKAVSLGKRILRTETAAMTALSMMIYEYEM